MLPITMPCLDVRLVPRDRVVANTWNPNVVSPDKLELLRVSIIENGFCFPIVTIHDTEQDRFVIIDGFHRRLLCDAGWLDIAMVPVVVLRHTMAQRMTATMQFNRARGAHQVDLDAEVIRSLLAQGLSEEDIAVKLGMELDAVHRYKQIAGVADAFRHADYSLAWEMVP